MTVHAEFRGSDALGILTTADRDKFIAFLKIVQETKWQNGRITNPIRWKLFTLPQTPNSHDSDMPVLGSWVLPNPAEEK
jgi:hypothetical protein